MSTCRSSSVFVNGLNTKYSKTLTIFTLSTSLECTKFTAQTYSHIPNKIKFRHQGCMEWSLYKNSNGHGSDAISIASHSHCAISVSCWKAPLSSWSIRKQFQHGRCRVTYIYSNYVTLLSHRYVSWLTVSHRYLSTRCPTTVSSHGRNTNQTLMMDKKSHNLLQTVS